MRVFYNRLNRKALALDGKANDRLTRTVYFARSIDWARHDCRKFENYILHVQREKNSREKTIIENVETFETYCHDSYGDSTDANAVRGKLSFLLPERINNYSGYEKHIMVNDAIGYMFLPGIYCFGYTKQDMDECGIHNRWELENMLELAYPSIDTGTTFERKTATIGSSEDFHSSPYFRVKYLAIGEENISILKNFAGTWNSASSDWTEIYFSSKGEDKII